MHVAHLSRELARRGHQVVLLCSPGSRLASATPTKVADLSVPGYVALRSVFRAAQLLRAFRPDVVHVHYSRDLWVIVPALWGLPGVPLVFTKHIGTRRPKRDPLHAYLYRRVDQAIAISQVIARNLQETHPLPQRKIRVLYHGVDVDAFQAARAERDQVRRELGLERHHFVAGILGRLEPHKGHLEFIAMAERVAAELPHARFLIVGGETVGEEEKAEVIRRRWRESSARERICLTGFRSDVPRVLSAMDVFVFPSHAEAFGLVLIEAMAAGLPVVTSNCDGVLDVVEDGVTGWTVSPTDVDALAARVLELARDADLRERMAAAALTQARERFDLQRMLGELEGLYRHLTETRRTRLF